MRVVLITVGALFVAAAVLVIASFLPGLMSPNPGITWMRRWLTVLAVVGLVSCAAAFFFRWAYNIGHGNAPK